MVSKKISKKYEDFEESNKETEEIEVKRKSKKNIVIEDSTDDEELEKPKIAKNKKPYVQTEARKLAFEKALETRKKNIELKKQLKQVEEDKIKKLKDMATEKKKKKIEKIKKEIEEYSSESESEKETIIIKKKKKKPVKKIIYESDSSDDNDSETEPIKNRKHKPINVTVNNITQPPQPQPIKRIGRNIPSGFV